MMTTEPVTEQPDEAGGGRPGLIEPCNSGGADNNPISRLGTSFRNMFAPPTEIGDDSSLKPAAAAPAQTEAEKQKKHIETLEKARVDQDQTLAAVLTEMAEKRAHDEELKKRHDLEVEALQRENALLKDQLRQMETDIDDEYALHEYAKLIREQSPDVTDSAYVMRLKSQLVKSLHKMGVMSNQLDLINQEHDKTVHDLHNKIVEAENARTKAEVEFMNDLFVMERECNEMKEEYEAKLTSQQEMIAQLQIELDLEKEMKSDAMSYARHMKEEKRRRRSSTQSIDLLEAHAEQIEKEMKEKQEAEARLKTELKNKLQEVEQLRQTCTNQEKSMAKLRVDLKTLSYEKSQYAPMAKRSGEADAKRKARSVSARGA